MSEHHDALEALNKQAPLRDKLSAEHQTIKTFFPFIDRIAVAIYDPDARVLKTFIHSSGTDDPLSNYQALLDDTPSLKDILDTGLPRVINNLVAYEDAQTEHALRLGRFGYAASYTLPMFNNGKFFGFIFFNSRQANVFTETALTQLDIYGHVISLMVINELSSIQTLTAAVKTTGHITHQRDVETGSHLDRMSRYSLLIARVLAKKHNLNDEYIQHIFMFAPLHDIGKIGIPDSILLKPGPLDEEEAAIMRSHTLKGREIIDDLIANFGLDNVQHIDVLRNIVAYHHEALNGSGYPEGRQTDAIPLEARIVAVADVFDALTSNRPYKEAWSNQQAIEFLQAQAGDILDRDCVEALVSNMDEVLEIQRRFTECF